MINLQQQIKAKGYHHAETQYPQTGHGLVGQNPVIDIHDKDRRSQSDQVDKQRSDGNVDIGTPEGRQNISQPVLVFNGGAVAEL